MPDTPTQPKDNMDINEARKRIESLWGDCGQCGSCGWHGALYEYEIDDEDIEYAINDGCVLWLPCINKDDNSGHRGVKIYFGDDHDK